jgi:hydrogenase 3 maturation protease
MLPADVAERLRRIVSANDVVFVAMGNILLGDDGTGPELAAGLSALGYAVIDAGTVPENHIGAVAKRNPRTVILLDAVHLGREPGAVELLDRQAILDGTGFSTHHLSPALVMERLEAETGAEVLMLAIQPATLEMGAPLSPPVAAVLGDVANFFNLLAE